MSRTNLSRKVSNTGTILVTNNSVPPEPVPQLERISRNELPRKRYDADDARWSPGGGRRRALRRVLGRNAVSSKWLFDSVKYVSVCLETKANLHARLESDFKMKTFLVERYRTE